MLENESARCKEKYLWQAMFAANFCYFVILKDELSSFVNCVKLSLIKK